MIAYVKIERLREDTVIALSITVADSPIGLAHLPENRSVPGLLIAAKRVD